MHFYIVDDDPDMLALVQRLLREAGHDASVNVSPRSALHEILEQRPDCVLLDILMPEMDGLELCRELRANPMLSRTKIIVLSTKPYDVDRRRAKELGADGYLVKPIEIETVVQSLLELATDHLVLTYWGVRGTLPVCGPKALRYGGNTACVSVQVGGEPLFIFDCGTGIKSLSDYLGAVALRRFAARVFISHTHWDHINTLPFFAPLYARGNEIEVYGPYQGQLGIARAVGAQMDGVFFPVTVREFGAHVEFHDLREQSLMFGPVRIDTMLLRHPGYCLGYRLSAWGRTLCYVTDNELHRPGDARYDAHYLARLVEFVGGADVLITDATYRDHEYVEKLDWGHSCVGQVAELAARAQVKRLHLFHHDPEQTDNDIDRKLAEARERLTARGATLECHAPAEGLRLVL